MNKILCVIVSILSFASVGNAEDSSPSKVELKIDELRERYLAMNEKSQISRVLNYEFTKSGSDAVYMAEIYLQSSKGKCLMRLWLKGEPEAAKYFYMDSSVQHSRLLSLNGEDSRGLVLKGIADIKLIFEPINKMLGELFPDEANDSQNKKGDDGTVTLFPSFYLFIKSGSISSGIGVASKPQLPWGSLAEDVSEIVETDDQYKLMRPKHGGYFILNKKSGRLIEQKETLNGITKMMKLTSDQPWKGEIEKMLPNLDAYIIEHKRLDVEMLDVLSNGMISSMVSNMVSNNDLYKLIKKDPAAVQEKLKTLYRKLWNQGENSLVPPVEWNEKKNSFGMAVNQWTHAEKITWKKKNQDQAMAALKVQFFPFDEETSKNSFFAPLVTAMNLKAAEKERLELQLGTFYKALYESWAEAEIEKVLKAL